MAGAPFEVHLVDGTYELFRHHFAVPSHLDPDGMEVAAVRGVLGTVMGMLEQGATHLGVATDHVVESFRNDLWIGYKTSEGMDPELLDQFPLLEDGLRALGVTVWAMVDLEADDALGVGRAGRRATTTASKRALICTPDKDLGQCVEDPQRRAARPPSGWEAARRGRRCGSASVWGHARSPTTWRSWATVPTASRASRAGVRSRPRPSSPATSTSTAIPDDVTAWEVDVRGAAKLAATLAEAREAAELFLDLATLRTDADVGAVDDWEWRGATPELDAWAKRLGAENLVVRAERLARKRFG